MYFHPCFQLMIVILVVGKDYFQAWKILRAELTQRNRLAPSVTIAPN
jgi:hypothetical protein